MQMVYYSYFDGAPGGPIIDFPFFFTFAGRSPPTVTESVNKFLGTLLSEYLTPAIAFKTAKVDSTTRNFDFTNNAQLPLDQTSGGTNYCFGGPSNPFRLTLTFDLPLNTSHVLTDNHSFMHENEVKDQFSRVGPLEFSDINLSVTPQTGKVSVNVFRKRPSSNFPDNKVRITIAGKLSGGATFTSTGRVKFTCP